MAERVVITGLGPLSPLGLGNEAFFRNLNGKATCIEPIPESYFSYYKFASRRFVPLPSFRPEDFNIPAYYLKAMQAEDKMAVLAAKFALEDAGFEVATGPKTLSAKGLPEDSAIILGTGFSGLENAFKSFLSHVDPNGFSKTLPTNTKNRFHRLIIPMMMPNSVSAWVSILFNLHGPSHTINASCASGTYAVGEAFRSIREGRSKLAITGGVENLRDEFGAIMRGFDLMGILTKSPDGPPEAFSKSRSGFLFSEGAACFLILEELKCAMQRNAKIYAEVLDFQANSDACNIVQMDPSGEKVVKILKNLRGERRIDYLNSHGTGTIPNDNIEYGAIRRVFGEKEFQPAVNSSKSLLGHTIGASGAFEAAITANAVKTGVVHGYACSQPLEQLNVITETHKIEVNSAVSVSFGFGGHNGGLLMGKADV